MKKIKTSKMKIKMIGGKHPIVFALLIYLAMNMAKAQMYYPLPTQNAYWTVYEYNEFNDRMDDVIYTVDGDTLINGFNYTKVYKLNDYPTIYDTVKILHCLMRQTKAENKIWFIRTYLGETTEKLGYNLSVNIGDTVSLPAFDYGNVGDSLYILADTSYRILYNGEHRKWYGFFSIKQYNGPINYIEGITDYNSTFPNFHYHYDYFHQSSTQCVNINNQYVWHPFLPDTTKCGFNLVSSNKQNKKELQIIPNPADNYTFIRVSPINDRNVLSIFNVYGNNLYQTILNQGTEQYILDLTKFTPGIYFIELQSHSSVICKKLIIDH